MVSAIFLCQKLLDTVRTGQKWFQLFFIDFQLFYFLTRIIPVWCTTFYRVYSPFYSKCIFDICFFSGWLTLLQTCMLMLWWLLCWEQSQILCLRKVNIESRILLKIVQAQPFGPVFMHLKTFLEYIVDKIDFKYRFYICHSYTVWLPFWTNIELCPLKIVKNCKTILFLDDMLNYVWGIPFLWGVVVVVIEW